MDEKQILEQENVFLKSKADAEAILHYATMAMITYLEDSEHKHYEEDPQPDHIFLAALRAHSAIDWLAENQ